jgi:hypothetical protein
MFKPKDWFSVTHEDLALCGVHVQTKAQLREVLTQLYPDIDWHKLSLWKPRYGEQRKLERVIRLLFEVFFPLLCCHSVECLITLTGRRDKSECSQRNSTSK